MIETCVQVQGDGTHEGRGRGLPASRWREEVLMKSMLGTGVRGGGKSSFELH